MAKHPLRTYLESLDPPITETEFARRAGISLPALSRVLCGHRRRVNAEACMRLSAATEGKVTLEQLLVWGGKSTGGRGSKPKAA